MRKTCPRNFLVFLYISWFIIIVLTLISTKAHMQLGIIVVVTSINTMAHMELGTTAVTSLNGKSQLELGIIVLTMSGNVGASGRLWAASCISGFLRLPDLGHWLPNKDCLAV